MDARLAWLCAWLFSGKMEFRFRVRAQIDNIFVYYLLFIIYFKIILLSFSLFGLGLSVRWPAVEGCSVVMLVARPSLGGRGVIGGALWLAAAQ